MWAAVRQNILVTMQNKLRSASNMNSKDRLQRAAALRCFIVSVDSELNLANHLLDSVDSDSRLPIVLANHYSHEWKSIEDVESAVDEFKNWLGLAQSNLLCWVPNAGAFENTANWFASHLSKLLLVSRMNLLLSTTNGMHGAALLKGEHDVGIKIW